MTCETCNGTGVVYDSCREQNCCPSDYPCPACQPKLANLGEALDAWRDARPDVDPGYFDRLGKRLAKLPTVDDDDLELDPLI